ncbi:MAG: transglutaminase domain-containing protein [Marinifilaceae bacterium]
MKTSIQLKITLISILLFTGITGLRAEQAPIKFGKVSKKELQMKTYAADTSAAAVVLRDLGQTEILFDPTEGFVMNFKRTVRIKILKKEGLNWGDFMIRIHKAGDNMTSLRGYTFNLENGKIIKEKLNSKSKFIEKTTKYFETYKITMPNVKRGSVIDFTYNIRSKSSFNLRTWYFQKSIPVVWSQYQVTIPEYFHYKKMSKGYLRFAVSKHEYDSRNFGNGETFSVERFTWAVENAPAFRKEPYMTTSRNFLSAMEFELAGIQQYQGPYRDYTNSWEKINEQLIKSEHFGHQLKSGGFLKEEVTRINAQNESEEEKMKAAFSFIKNHMKWNDYNSIQTSASLRKTFKEKTGNVCDINLMLVLLLRELGLNANPVVLSTRDNGMINPTLPNISIFNYVIARVRLDQKTLLLDATNPLNPCDFLPFQCLNNSGRIISERGTQEVDLKARAPYKKGVLMKLNLLDEGELEGQITLSKVGYSAHGFRERMAEKSEEDIITVLEEDYEGINVEELEIQNMKKLEQSVRTKLQVSISEKIDASADLIYLNPMLYEQIKKNPFSLEERKYPVDFGHPYDETYILELTLPDGVVLEDKPENLRLALPAKSGSYTYSIRQLNNKLQIISRLCINKTMFVSTEYPGLKEFYNRIVAKQAEMLILKRNS